MSVTIITPQNIATRLAISTTNLVLTLAAMENTAIKSCFESSITMVDMISIAEDLQLMRDSAFAVQVRNLEYMISANLLDYDQFMIEFEKMLDEGIKAQAAIASINIVLNASAKRSLELARKHLSPEEMSVKFEGFEQPAWGVKG
jgi:hypothetical protein